MRTSNKASRPPTQSQEPPARPKEPPARPQGHPARHQGPPAKPQRPSSLPQGPPTRPQASDESSQSTGVTTSDDKDIAPFGAAALFTSKIHEKRSIYGNNRAREPMTTYCLWASSSIILQLVLNSRLGKVRAHFEAKKNSLLLIRAHFEAKKNPRLSIKKKNRSIRGRARLHCTKC